jgi:hypothetical protein
MSPILPIIKDHVFYIILQRKFMLYIYAYKGKATPQQAFYRPRGFQDV